LHSLFQGWKGGMGSNQGLQMMAKGVIKKFFEWM